MTAGLGRLLAWLVLACACCASAFAQQGLVSIPALTSHVVDQTNTFDAIELKGLDEKLLDYEKRKGTQIAVLMVASTQPEDIASFANRAANSWKIGRKGVGDGVLIVVAKDDHKVRIEVAKSLEGAVPDLAAKNIIDDVVTPNFRKGEFAAGLRQATDRLIARIDGEALPEPKQPKASAGGNAGGLGALGNIDWTTAAMFIFIGVPVVGGILKGILGRTFGSLVTGAGVGTIALLVTSSLLMAGIAAFIALLVALFTGAGMGRRGGLGGVPIVWGGGGGSGGSGGGGGGSSWGGSGGGGDFGGGGASGSW